MIASKLALPAGWFMKAVSLEAPAEVAAPDIVFKLSKVEVKARMERDSFRTLALLQLRPQPLTVTSESVYESLHRLSFARLKRFNSPDEFSVTLPQPTLLRRLGLRSSMSTVHLLALHRSHIWPLKMTQCLRLEL